LRLGAPPVLIDPAMGLRNVKFAIQQTSPTAFVGSRKAQVVRRIFGWGRGSIRTALTVEPLPDALVNETEAGRQDASGSPAPEGIAAIAFTSGSTGAPKGVVFDHDNLRAQADLVRELLGSCAGESHLVTFPLFLLYAGVLGVTAVIPDMDSTRPAAASPSRLIAAIEDYRCRSAFASPVLVQKLGRYCRDTGHRLSTMERVLSAGAPLDAKAMSLLVSALAPGGEVFTPYGATEALPISNIGSREILGETVESTRRGAGVCIGYPLRGIDAKIIPITDGPCDDWSDVPMMPTGRIGEIAVSGRVVSRAYFNNARATIDAKIPVRGSGAFFHRMGDLGYFDDRGRLWMCGRKSHRVAATNRAYFTVPIEGIFNAHPNVARTALVGVPDAGGELMPVLCVELTERKSGGAKRRITEELRALGRAHEATGDIRHFLYHRGFPVDARHNSKIRREVLSVWAGKKIGGRQSQ